MGLEAVQLIQFPKIPDDRGNLSFFENERQIPFVIVKVYWISDVPGGQKRKGYACKTQQECIVALSGSFDVVINNGVEKVTYTLNRPNIGLVVPAMLWRYLDNFATNSLALVTADGGSLEDDLIYDEAVYQLVTHG